MLRSRTLACPLLVVLGRSAQSLGQATPSADASLVSFPTQTPSPAASQNALGILTAREVTSARTNVVWSSPILATLPLVVQVPGAQSPGPATPSADANQV